MEAAWSAAEGGIASPVDRMARTLERVLRHVPYPAGVAAVGLAARLLARQAHDPNAPTWPGVAGPPSPAAIRERLLTTALGEPRLVHLARNRWPDEGSRWFAAAELPDLQAARATGRPILLVNSHFGAPQCVPLLLARLGHRFHSVECRDPFAALRLRRPEGLAIIATSRSFLGQVAVAARRALLDEGMLCIAADGYVGASGVTVPFHGRARRFAGGFAELAVATGAVVLPVLAALDEEGRTTLRAFPPLAETDKDAPRARRVEQLIRSYADWLAQRWRERPGNVFNVERFAALPAWPAPAEV